jgi:hypothetical protein
VASKLRKTSSTKDYLHLPLISLACLLFIIEAKWRGAADAIRGFFRKINNSG